jgi:hypothetical protein
VVEPTPSPEPQFTADDLLGQNYADPATHYASFTYKTFAGRPLFGDAGPLATDVAQGQVGDCYYLAVLAAIADTDPSQIRQSVVDLGDGTYAVQFVKGGSKVYVRVDADLPTYSGSNTLAYAKLGAQGSMWVAVMEKAYAYVRTPAIAYASLDSGWMGEANSILGIANRSTYSAYSAMTLMQAIASDLASGKAVTYAVGNVNGAPLIGWHAYSVEAVYFDANGVPVSMKLRNPWGYDGAGSDGNTADGYVTITSAQAYANLLGYTAATV